MAGAAVAIHAAMKNRSLLVALALLAAGCGTSDPRGSGRQAQAAACRAVCANVVEAGCKASSDEEACLEACREKAEIVATSDSDHCHEAFAAWSRCAAEAELECDGFAVSMLPCRADRDHVRNYCELGLGPDEPCLDNPVYAHLCPEEKPRALNCRGRPEAGCVVGGTDNHVDLYCCP